MPVRMPENHRVRGSRRVMVLIGNVNKFNAIVCHYCLNPVVGYPCIDHVECRANGGDAKDINNLIVACNTCNTRKGSKSVAEVFGQAKHDEICAYMDERNFSPNDLVKAREINRMFSKTADVLQAVVEYGGTK
jgi:hypothetical protein